MTDRAPLSTAPASAPPGVGDAVREHPVVAHATRLALLAQRLWELSPAEGHAHDRARQLRDHVTSYVLPRARSLDTPLVVTLLGPTGAGKSTLFNTIAGAPVSRTGVLRPTTREAVLLATPADATVVLEGGPLASLPPGRLEHVVHGARPGLALVDAPDVDSIEHDNRALADQLVEASDLCVFVTTATRYADQVPWDVLARVRERGLPLLVVVNRLPALDEDALLVLEDVRRLFAQAGLGERGHLEVVAVREGEHVPETASLQPDRVLPLVARIDALSADRDARRALAAEALAGALAGLGPLVHAAADDLEHRAIDADALRRLAETIYAEELRALLDEVSGGQFLRQEVLAQWHTFVGADQVTRFFSTGIGRIRGAIASAIRGTPSAPVAAVEEQATSDLAAVSVAHADDAARRTAGRWREQPMGAEVIAAEPALWSATSDFRERLERRLADWIAAIAEDVRVAGASKRSLARGASLGINAAGTTVMLSVFAHTGGLTGAEMGVAAATAFLNQKLLHALFGEAAVIEMIDRARRGLAELLTATMQEDRARFDALAVDGEALRGLAAELRTLARRVMDPAMSSAE